MELKLGCVILASGEGSRFGGNKLLADFGGKPMLAWLMENLPERLEPVVVTRDAGVQRLAEQYGLLCVRHDCPHVCDTIRLGLEWLYQSDGCLFCVGDQPLLTRETLERMIAAFEAEPEAIHRAAFEERMGNPVFFPKRLYDELMALEPGENGGTVMARHGERISAVQADFVEELQDVDTQEALQALEAFRLTMKKE